MMKILVKIIIFFILLIILGGIFVLENQKLKETSQISNIPKKNIVICDAITETIPNNVIEENTNEETIKETQNIVVTKQNVNVETKIENSNIKEVQKKENILTEKTETPKKETEIIEDTTPSPAPTETPEEKPEEASEETYKKNGYFYNESETKFLISEFKRLTNSNDNFSVRISETAKNSNAFYPYKESEVYKQVCNIAFGSFIVYAEDYYIDDVKQRTLYYITFDR